MHTQLELAATHAGAACMQHHKLDKLNATGRYAHLLVSSWVHEPHDPTCNAVDADDRWTGHRVSSTLQISR